MKSNCFKPCFHLINAFSILLLETISVCEMLDARVSLKVEGNGFHRYLTYKIHVDKLMDDCYTAVYLELPPSLYVNTNELIDLTRLGITTACSVGESDTELFAEKANAQNMTVCSPLLNGESVLNLPMHQRYQYAKENNVHAIVTLPKPKLFLGCKGKIQEYRVTKINLCSSCAEIIPKWREIPYVMDDEDFIWTIPIGDSSTLSIIIYITLSLTILCTIFLSKTIWTSSVLNEQKKTE